MAFYFPQASDSPAPPSTLDPIRYCVYTTVALLAWLVSPPVMVMAMSGLGLWAYWRACAAGSREANACFGIRGSSCFISEPCSPAGRSALD